MYHVELFDISARLSQALVLQNPLHVKVSKVLDEWTFELKPCTTPVQQEDFFDVDLDNVLLSPEQKAKIHLRYHNSTGSYDKVVAFVMALQELCDSGISLCHDGDRVVDMWVMHTTEFDVSDILYTKILRIRDPKTCGVTPVMNTYEKMERQKGGPKRKKRFGFDVTGASDMVDQLQQSHVSTNKHSVPHWWVAATIERDGYGDATERLMVHIDICGAGFGDYGVTWHNGKLVSLQMFLTPEYMLSPVSKLRGDLRTFLSSRQKFFVDSGCELTLGKWQKPMFLEQCNVGNHYLNLSRTDTADVEVIPLNTFVVRSTRFMLENLPAWLKTVAEVRHYTILGLPVGTNVEICNLEKRPELNGLSGRIHEKVSDSSKDRVPVFVADLGKPLGVKTTCVRLTTRKQYSSHTELLSKTGDADPTAGGKDVESDVSESDEAKLGKILRADPQLKRTSQVVMSGKTVSAIHFADPNFKNGIAQLLEIPQFHRVVPSSTIKFMTSYREVANHPRANDAFKMIRFMRNARRRAVQKDPSIEKQTSLLGIHNDYDILLLEISKKIRTDPGLNEVFTTMDRTGLFPSPVLLADEKFPLQR